MEARSTTAAYQQDDACCVRPRHALGDDGYTLMELMLVVVILGILTSAVALVVTGMSTEAAETGCQADRHLMHVSAESFFAQTGNRTIPATGADHDRYEATLVAAGFLRAPSSYHDVTPTGTLTPQAGSPC